MKDRLLRFGLLAFVATGVAACDDDSVSPDGTPSEVTVSVYVEDDGEQGLTAGDVALEGAQVTLTSNEENEDFTGTTGADGMVVFSGVPAGTYTLTHTATPPTGAALTSATEQTVVAPFSGDSVSTDVIYMFSPSSVSGTIFRDENGNGTFEADTDETLAGFEVLLFEGSDTTVADTVAADTTGAEGMYSLEGIARGDYTLLVHPPQGTELPGGPTYPLTLAADENAVLNIEFTGGEAAMTIAEARDQPLDAVVTVEGVVTAGTDVFSSTSAYIQDPTAGIVVDFFGDDDGTTALTLGDSVRVTGPLAVFNDELRIGSQLEVEILGAGAVPDPRVVTGQDVIDGLFQGELVEVMSVTVDSIPDPGFNTEVWVSEGDDDFVIFVDGTTGLSADYFVIGSTYNITGIMSRFRETFQIKPRSSADIELTSTPAGTVDVALARVTSPGETVTVECVVTAGTDVYSSTTAYCEDATAGIVVDQFGLGSGNAVAYTAGDSLEVTGEVDVFNDEVRLGGSALAVTVLGTAAVPDPTSVTAAGLNAGAYQGQLVVADSVEIIDVEDGAVAGDNYEVIAADETGEMVIFIDADTNIDPAVFTEGESYEVVGTAARFFETFEIKPRTAADITALP